MHQSSLSSTDLVVQRARLVGGGGRHALERGLSSVIVSDITEAGEVLLVPRLAVSAKFKGGAPPSLFATRLTDQLRAVRNAAIVDPLGLPSTGGALRFTSQARFAAWLVALELRGQLREARACYSTAGPLQDVRNWQRRTLLPDAPLLVATVATLAAKHLATDWVRRLSSEEVQIAASALQRSYNLPMQSSDWETEIERAPAFADVATVKAGAARRSTTIHRIATPFERSLYHIIEANLLRSIAQENEQFCALTIGQQRLIVVLASLKARPAIGPVLTPTVIQNCIKSAIAATSLESIKAPDQQAVQSGDHAASPFSASSLEEDQPATLYDRPARSLRRMAKNDQHDAEAAPFAKARKTKKSSAAIPAVSATFPQADCAFENHNIALQRIETSFGGLLFLTNALLALGLYPDFTRPLDRGLHPSPFWLIDQLGQRLFGQHYRADPLHRWFEENSLPGPLPEIWEVQRVWLTGLPKAAHSLRRTRSSTLLWDERGFALYDGLTATAPRSLLRRFAFAGKETARGSFWQPRPIPRSASARWVACLVEFLRFRLSLACDGMALDQLALPAAIEIGIERIDCYFTLAAFPIEIRMAGLDRNPGWLPTEGRALAFHFS
ncbi:hypothetical protein [Sphingorhabdus sp.]|uniref:hypothetical protein n=2 Tax=Sphingorhabdus sp. TaxID=1902408 RepID=UPI003C74B1A3